MRKKIIVAPLNWGLGHASRCIPIIQFLQKNHYTPVLASDGEALLFLRKEFPDLESLELPPYEISYAKNLKIGLLMQVPKVLNAVLKEQKVLQKYIRENTEVVGVISDNRLGARSTAVPSVYITHQLRVLSGCTSFFSSKIHQLFINKFDECWVPDTKSSQFSGKLSKSKGIQVPLKYIGVLSRFTKEHTSEINDVLVVLSGIESQRTVLEQKIISVLASFQGNVVLVQGNIEKEQTVTMINGIKKYNYLLSEDLEREINQSKLIICRSGYSSIMDLAVLQKKACFIPTPNQPEQEYLAAHLKEQQMALCCHENEFSLAHLEQVKSFKALHTEPSSLNPTLLSLFERK